MPETTATIVAGEVVAVNQHASTTTTTADNLSGQEDQVTQTVTPSHILANGRFVHLPPPSRIEQQRFFERSVARHGLLAESLRATQTTSSQSQQPPHPPDDEDATSAEEGGLREDDEEMQLENAAAGTGTGPTAKKEPQVHPLALASARIQALGIQEMNRAINLSGLVSTGEYFTLSNIVDPSLDLSPGATADPPRSTAETPAPAATAPSESSTAVAPTTAEAAATTPAGSSAHSLSENASSLELQEEQRIKAAYVLKRKVGQFRQAGQMLRRHARRLAAAVAAQAPLDARWRQWRPTWRLVAPEHGTRAWPHAVRPTEVVACDVDVYWQQAGLGRLARRVPRFATVELPPDFKVSSETIDRLLQGTGSEEDGDHGEDDDDDDAMAVDREEALAEKKARSPTVATSAEPFAMADPTLGKLDADFDPKQVVMLTLEFEIEKPCTGYGQSARLASMAAPTAPDEQVLMALQHSLFCAKLFESIRRELAPDTEDMGQISPARASSTRPGLASTATTSPGSYPSGSSQVVWLSGESPELFLPPPSLMSQGDRASRLLPLCVVHCHEGEVKVQLDSEYTLRAKLVDAQGAGEPSPDPDTAATMMASSATSGSQTPEQLKWLCEALLLHAQESYHRHSVQQSSAEDPSAATRPAGTRGPPPAPSSPHILQKCVSLGAKMLLESRIRQVLRRVQRWLLTYSHQRYRLEIHWLSLSVLDWCAQFTVALVPHHHSRHAASHPPNPLPQEGDAHHQEGASNTVLWYMDAELMGDQLTVTQWGDDGGDYRKVHFYSDREWELFVRLALRRRLKKTGSNQYNYGRII